LDSETTEIRKPKKVLEKIRAIIGLVFLIFFLPKEIGKNKKIQPGATTLGGAELKITVDLNRYRGG
jgi:hypothetical protein